MKTAFITALLTLTFAPAFSAEYAVDKGHSALIWSVKHLGLGYTYGRFNDFAGTITYDANNLKSSAVNITAQVGSIDSNDTKRDGHLRSADFFDAATFPTMTFVGTGFQAGEKEGTYSVTGKLTLRGVSKEITVPFKKTGEGEHFFAKKPAIGFEGQFSINPKDYGVGQGKAGGSIGDTVRIIVALEGIQK